MSFPWESKIFLKTRTVISSEDKPKYFVIDLLLGFSKKFTP